MRAAADKITVKEVKASRQRRSRYSNITTSSTFLTDNTVKAKVDTKQSIQTTKIHRTDLIFT